MQVTHKVRQTYKRTTNSRIYKMVHRELHTSCSFCKPNRIENRKSKLSRSWKRFRKTRWKEVK